MLSRRLFPALFLFALAPIAAQQNVPFPGAIEMEQSLARLNQFGTVLMIAAHPDDEQTAVLAYFARGRHMRTAYLSLTRGEGGQNLIGSEQGPALGVIRTQELLAARKIDGAEQFFTRAIDFGFTKTASETMEKWGHDRILSDVVWVIRRYRPDVMILVLQRHARRRARAASGVGDSGQGSIYGSRRRHQVPGATEIRPAVAGQAPGAGQFQAGAADVLLRLPPGTTPPATSRGAPAGSRDAAARNCRPPAKPTPARSIQSWDIPTRNWPP
jgi:LmbE family N-acetylglucosaminyl deacetylase